VYTGDEIDAIAAYCEELESCYLIPAEMLSGKTQLHLRLEPSRNNQRSRIHWARNYEFDARLDPGGYGPIAQLGERRAGSAKAAGSSPAGSTS
jgi:hypothetical protein